MLENINNQEGFSLFQWPSKDTFNLFDVQYNTMILSLSGSRAYGTNSNQSDWDYKGILYVPLEYAMNLFQKFDQLIYKSEDYSGRVSEVIAAKEKLCETTLFGLNKFIQLATNSNPNALEILFASHQAVTQVPYNGQILINNRNLFLSQKAVYAFIGYADGQLHRLLNHKAWYDKAPSLPFRKDFGLSENTNNLNESEIQAAIKYIQQNAINIAPWIENKNNDELREFWYSVASIIATLQHKEGYISTINLENWFEIQEGLSYHIAYTLGMQTDFMDLLKKEKKYYQALKQYKQYEEWKKNRNVERSKLEEAWGFDTKHAMHLVRLLRMGEELLLEGKFEVFRKDRQELIDIREGKVPLQDICDWASTQKEKIYTILKNNSSDLPKQPNYKLINEIYLDFYHTL